MVAFIDLPYGNFPFCNICNCWSFSNCTNFNCSFNFRRSSFNPTFFKRFSEKFKTQQSKMMVLHELLNIETKNCTQGKFLEDRWNKSIESQTKGASARGINFTVIFTNRSSNKSSRYCMLWCCLLTWNNIRSSIACNFIRRILSPLVRTTAYESDHAFSAFYKVNDLMMTDSRDEKTENYKAANIQMEVS